MTVFVAVSQISPDRVTYALRTASDPLRYVKSVHEIVREADSSIPVTNVVTQAAEIDRTISREITFARLCTGFAVLALLIACVGLYGTMSYNVARQIGEIGMRMALAQARQCDEIRDGAGDARGADRRRHRPCRCSGTGASASEFAVRGRAHGPGHVRVCDPAALRGRPAGVLRPRPACRADRPDGGPTL